MLKVLRRPIWALGLVIVVVWAVVCVNLGFWQLRRLDETRDRNARIEERVDAAPVPIESLFDDGLTTGDAADAGSDATRPTAGVDTGALEYTHVRARGTYRTDEEVLVKGRSYRGQPGYWAITPLVLDGGQAVLVNRGYVPLAAAERPPWPQAVPPEGPVEVVGYLRPTERRGVLGATDPDTGRLVEVARIDIDRIAAQVEEPVLPLAIQLESQDPAQADGGYPVPLERPEVDEGNHLSYAVQWFLFALIPVLGFPILLRRAGNRPPGEGRRRRRRPRHGDPSSPSAPPPPDPATLMEPLPPEWRLPAGPPGTPGSDPRRSASRN